MLFDDRCFVLHIPLLPIITIATIRTSNFEMDGKLFLCAKIRDGPQGCMLQRWIVDQLFAELEFTLRIIQVQ